MEILIKYHYTCIPFKASIPYAFNSIGCFSVSSSTSLLIVGFQDQESCSKISRVVIAGNALSQCTQTKDSETKVML